MKPLKKEIQRIFQTNKIVDYNNLIPHPVTLFVFLSIFLIFLSALFSFLDFSVADPRPVGAVGRSQDGLVKITNLLDFYFLEQALTHVVINFTNFAPLGFVLVSVLAISIAEYSGWLSTTLRYLLVNTSKRLLTANVIFVCILSNAAMPLGYVVLVPLSAMLFYSAGRHPLAGLACGYAGAGAGYAANLIISTIDPILSGITETSARVIDPHYTVGPEANWYFMSASVVLLTGVGVFITEKYVEPKLGVFNSAGHIAVIANEPINTREVKAIKVSAAVFFLLILAIGSTLIPNFGIFNGGAESIASDAFFKSMIAFIFIIFSVPGLVYGYISGSMNCINDVVEAMKKGISSISVFIVIIFIASQFITWLSWSNIPLVLAVIGAEFLNESSLHGAFLFFIFIVFCAFINLFIASSAVQWAIMAPVVIPIFMGAGYSPELVQVAYRIGDSVTNVITPMMPYFAMTFMVALNYYPKFTVYKMLTLMLPYSLTFLMVWSVMFYFWVFIFEIPVGPNIN